MSISSLWLRYCMPWRGRQSPHMRLGRDCVKRWVGLSMWKARLCILHQVSHQTESMCRVYPAMWMFWLSSPTRTTCYTYPLAWSLAICLGRLGHLSLSQWYMACLPAFMVKLPFKEIAEAVYITLSALGGIPLRPGDFPFFSLLMLSWLCWM
jgi:hypothetical protein